MLNRQRGNVRIGDEVGADTRCGQSVPENLKMLYTGFSTETLGNSNHWAT